MKLLSLLKAFTPMAKKLPPLPKNATETIRTILYQTENVSVVCFRWKKFNGLPEHDHAGKCLFNILDGKLYETRCGGMHQFLYKNTTSEINKGIKHSIMPLEDSRSIHVYSPPPPSCLVKK